MDLKELLHLVAKEEQEAIKELYDKYKVAFYYTAMDFFKDRSISIAVATESFRRIIDNAYKFDEELNAEYWLFDVLCTISINALISQKIDSKNEKIAADEGLEQDVITSAARSVHYFTNLDYNEIASILRVRKSVVAKCLKDKSKESLENNYIEHLCPEYFEQMVSKEPTGYEKFSEKERILTQKGEKKQKNMRFNKRLVSILLAISFLCIVVIGIVKLVNRNYGSDVDRNLLGEDILTQSKNKMPCTQMDEYVYFCGEDNKLYRRGLNGDENECISQDYPKELINDGKYVYYRNNEDGFMYRINSDGSGRKQLCNVPGTTMTLYKDRLYFSATGGIYSIPSSGADFDEATLILDTSYDANLFCVDMGVDSLGNVFFASGIGKGVHQITTYNSQPSVAGIFTDEVYNICIDEDVLYFDCKDMTGEILLYSFDIKAHLNNESDKRILPSVVSDSKGENAELTTGAFYVNDNVIYFAGKNNGKNVLYKLDENRKKTIVTDVPSENGNLEITDIFVSDKGAFCYCSDGKKKGERVFFFCNREKEIMEIF